MEGIAVAKMNIARLMVPKVFTKFLHETDSIRQGLELMELNHFTALPVLDCEERFVGCISEGDFLRHIIETGSTDKRFHEKYRVSEILRKDFCPAIRIDAETDTVIEAMMKQNFLPVVDDRNMLCGILTRSSVIAELAGKRQA